MRLHLAVGLMAVLAGPLARAEGVSEEEFLAPFGEEHVSVRALQENLARAEAIRIKTRTLANPTVEFWHEAPEDNPRVANWTIAWTPPLDRRQGLRRRSAEKGLVAARELLNLDLANLRRELRRTFSDWSLGFERRAVLRTQRDLVVRLAEQERQRARVGEASGLAARRFTLAEAEVRAELAKAEAESMMAEAVARAWRPELPPESIPEPLTLAPPLDDLDASDSPELRALVLEKEQAEIDVRGARRYWGFPELRVGWQTLQERDVVHGGPIFAVGWSVPLFDRDRAARWEALRRKDIAVARASLAETRIAGEIQGGVAAYGLLFRSAEEAEQASRETDRVIEAVSSAFLAGEATLTDLLESLRTAFGALIAEIDARARAAKVYRDLEAMRGGSFMKGGGR